MVYYPSMDSFYVEQMNGKVVNKTRIRQVSPTIDFYVDFLKLAITLDTESTHPFEQDLVTLGKKLNLGFIHIDALPQHVNDLYIIYYEANSLPSPFLNVSKNKIPVQLKEASDFFSPYISSDYVNYILTIITTGLNSSSLTEDDLSKLYSNTQYRQQLINAFRGMKFRTTKKENVIAARFQLYMPLGKSASYAEVTYNYAKLR